MRISVEPDVFQEQRLRHIVEVNPPRFVIILEPPEKAGCAIRNWEFVIVDIAERCAGMGEEPIWPRLARSGSVPPVANTERLRQRADHRDLLGREIVHHLGRGKHAFRSLGRITLRKTRHRWRTLRSTLVAEE